jgi:hypothetical protein
MREAEVPIFSQIISSLELSILSFSPCSFIHTSSPIVSISTKLLDQYIFYITTPCHSIINQDVRPLSINAGHM